MMHLLFKDEIIKFVYMKKWDEIKTVTHLGVKMKLKIKYVDSIDGLTGKVLFPEKLKEANEMLSKIKNLDEILNKKPS